MGSGPGGAIIARKLAEGGASVIVVEAGPVVRKNDFVQEAGFTLAKYFWDAGLRTTMGGNVVMPTMQPRVLGGGSVFNSAICIRMPDFTLRRWQEQHGVTVTQGEMERHFDAVERFMGVRTTRPEVQGRRNELFAEGCRKVGLTPTPIARNEDGCQGTSECLTGCRVDGKLSTDRRGVPEILRLGGTVYTSVHVDRLVFDGDRATGLVGWTVAPSTFTKGAEVRLHARKGVILAAGALASPVILLNSGFTGGGTVGRHVNFHPSTALMGIFDEEVHPWSGAAQGMHCLDFLDRGVKLESLWAVGSLLSFRMPGVGPKFQSLIADWKHMACWDAWASGEDSDGRIFLAPGGKPVISYNVGVKDMERLQFSMIKLSEMFFAAGAKRVLHGVNGLPDTLDRPEDIDLLRGLKMTPKTLLVGSNHVYGGMTMGGDRSRHSVGNDGRVYGLQNVYVADTGLFPASPGVNPMLTAMAFADRFGEQIVLQG